ncbi:MAG: urea amidolyase associated protein UAAP2 [Pseudomonadota bacterium]
MIPRDLATAHHHPIPASVGWSGRVPAGGAIRIVDTFGLQAVDTLFYSAADTAERYSAQDTVQLGRNAYVSEGTRLISNRGRLMLTVTHDTVGHHDTSAGACSVESNTVRFGHHTRHLHACRENFVTEGAKWGLTKRDIAPNINFFMNVPIEPDGKLAIVDGLSEPGNFVEMVAAMDVICLISNCPQINNPCNGFEPTPIDVFVWDA